MLLVSLSSSISLVPVSKVASDSSPLVAGARSSSMAAVFGSGARNSRERAVRMARRAARDHADRAGSFAISASRVEAWWLHESTDVLPRRDEQNMSTLFVNMWIKKCY